MSIEHNNATHRELAHFNTILAKLDQSVEKLTSISGDVTQLLAVHENKLGYQEKAHSALEKSIDKLDEKTVEITDGLHERINDCEKELLTKINEQNTKISGLQQWMWTAIGGGGAVLLLIDKILPAFLP